MNPWIEKHLSKQDAHIVQPKPELLDWYWDNDAPIALVWDKEEMDEPMPILHKNWVELQAVWQVYSTTKESQDRKERLWQKVFTRL